MPITINIGETEFYDELQQKYVRGGGTPVVLEHSLVSLSKWESEWEIPYLGDNEKTDEQVLDYVRCMAQGELLPGGLLDKLSESNVQAIVGYINAKQSATTVYEPPNASGPGSRKQTITSELIYSWMVQYRIPVEFEKWHLSRLLMLIRVLNEQNRDHSKNKMSKSQLAADRRRLNAQRRQQYNTQG